MKHHSFRINSVKYYHYKIYSKDFFIKEKGLVSQDLSDAIHEYDLVTKSTYRKNVKKGFKDNFIDLNNTDPLKINFFHLAKILSEDKGLNESSLRTGIYLAQEDLKELRKNKYITKKEQYRIFKELIKKYFLEEQERIKNRRKFRNE